MAVLFLFSDNRLFVVSSRHVLRLLVEEVVQLLDKTDEMVANLACESARLWHLQSALINFLRNVWNALFSRYRSSFLQFLHVLREKRAESTNDTRGGQLSLFIIFLLLSVLGRRFFDIVFFVSCSCRERKLVFLIDVTDLHFQLVTPVANAMNADDFSK